MNATTQQWLTAGPAESFWGRDMVTMTPRFSAPPPVHASRRAKAAPVKEVDYLDGVCMYYARPFRPCLMGDVPKGTPMILAPGSLNAAVDRITRGRQTCPLTMDHDGPVLARSMEGFWFSKRHNRLRVRVWDSTALTIIKARPGRRQLSLGMNRMKFEVIELRGRPMIVVTRADIYEVALVPAGAVPGAKLFL